MRIATAFFVCARSGRLPPAPGGDDNETQGGIR